MARAPIPGRCKTRLEPLLGPAGCARLQALLIERAAAWAVAAGTASFVAHDPAGADAAALVGTHAPGAVLFAQAGEDLRARLAGASARALAEHSGPLLIVGTDIPRLSERHAATALADLEDGIDVVLGPTLDGGCYLLGLARPLPELFALPADVWDRPEALALSTAATREAGLTVGLLGLERGLETPADARAARADPLMPAEIRALLGG